MSGEWEERSNIIQFCKSLNNVLFYLTSSWYVIIINEVCTGQRLFSNPYLMTAIQSIFCQQIPLFHPFIFSFYLIFSCYVCYSLGTNKATFFSICHLVATCPTPIHFCCLITSIFYVSIFSSILASFYLLQLSSLALLFPLIFVYFFCLFSRNLISKNCAFK